MAAAALAQPSVKADPRLIVPLDVPSVEAARLAAILPSPLKWKAENPGPYVRRRTGRIGAASGTVRRIGSADCVLD